MQLPIVKLNSEEFIQLTFDRLGDESSNRLRYKLVHCNTDWTPSGLSEIEYINGFNNNSIDDYAASINTTIEYTNFRLAIPNNDISPRLSGNYVILVYDEDNQQKTLLSACFSVLDSQVSIAGNMSSNTLIDSNREHQQVSFVVNHQGINIRDPFSEVKVFVLQNNRQDNMKSLVKPTYVQSDKLVYEQNRELIFEAGNEYRRFEAVSNRYNGLHVEQTEYKRPYYYTTIIPDQIRAGKRYIYDQDQNGRFYIRNAEGNDSDTEADYFFVRFSLLTDEPVLDKIYVTGDFSYNTFDENNLMQYDFDKEEYYTTRMMKQGVYNYMYLTQQGTKYSTTLTEGNYYEAENEYQIFVYFRPMGERYDSLIGFLNIGK